MSIRLISRKKNSEALTFLSLFYNLRFILISISLTHSFSHSFSTLNFMNLVLIIEIVLQHVLSKLGKYSVRPLTYINALNIVKGSNQIYILQ